MGTKIYYYYLFKCNKAHDSAENVYHKGTMLYNFFFKSLMLYFNYGSECRRGIPFEKYMYALVQEM